MMKTSYTSCVAKQFLAELLVLPFKNYKNVC